MVNADVNEQYKKNTSRHWNADPCGANYVSEKVEKYSKEYFDEVTSERYFDQNWLLDEIKKLNIRNKKVLEVGYGMGTDHLQLAKLGGKMFGISITPSDQEIINKRFSLYGYETNAIVGDAESMPYPDEDFDFVYSFGVLHHCPNMEKALSECYRVLKQGGQGYIAVYNKNSLFFWWSLFLCDYILHFKFLKMSLKERLSLLEYPNDDKGLVVKVTSKRKFRKMLEKCGFTVDNIHINHLNRKSVALERFFSDKFFTKNAGKFGWYVIADISK